MKKPDNVSEYTHYINCCEMLGILRENTKDFLNYLLSLDYITAQTDRHFNNFGIVRNVETLKIIGHSPIFDSGTSLWNGVATMLINSSSDVESKPFRNTHNEQMKLVTDNKWFQKEKFYCIEVEFYDILSKNTFCIVTEKQC